MNRPHPRILMCRPDFYGIEYEINPWMKREHATVHAVAVSQWENLVAILTEVGAHIELLPPVPGYPDMVFTANAGVVCNDLFVTSRFRHPERQGESAHFEAWFAEHGYRVAGLPLKADFEGAGDALYCGETLFAGYLHRSHFRAHQCLARLLGCQVLGLELVDPRFYHLDTCFCPLSPAVAIYYPHAFDDYGQRVLKEHVATLIAAEESDAIHFGCNAVVVGKHVVLNTGTDGLAAKLRELGYSPHQTPLGEFLKSGGSAKCLTLRLDGEEAAIW